jgi:hypothetical protein
MHLVFVLLEAQASSQKRSTYCRGSRSASVWVSQQRLSHLSHAPQTTHRCSDWMPGSLCLAVVASIGPSGTSYTQAICQVLGVRTLRVSGWLKWGLCLIFETVKFQEDAPLSDFSEIWCEVNLRTPDTKAPPAGHSCRVSTSGQRNLGVSTGLPTLGAEGGNRKLKPGRIRMVARRPVGASP